MAIGQPTYPSRTDDLVDHIGSYVDAQIAASAPYGRYFNVEDPAYGAAPDEFFTDGVANATTTFTSASANFTGADVGKTILIQRAGPSTMQDNHTTIASVTNSTTVVLTNTCQRSQTQARFYISRAGDQTSAIQACIDACSLAGGGEVFLPGVGYLVTQLILKNRVTIRGAGMRATCVHQMASQNKPVITNDMTSQNSAMTIGVRDMWVDGNRQRNSATGATTTLSAGYTAGNTSLSLTSSANFLPSGALVVGASSQRMAYSFNGTDIAGSSTPNVLNSVFGGTENTTDANVASGQTVTQNQHHCLYFAPVPAQTSSGAFTYTDNYDQRVVVQNVLLKNCKGDGIQMWGQQESAISNCWSMYCEEYGFRPSYDTRLDTSIAEQSGRAGFLLRTTKTGCTNLSSFYNGWNVPAEGFGYLIEGPSILEEGIRSLASCVAQDNNADGFLLRNAQRVVLQGTASSNGRSSAGTYCGIRIIGCTNGIIDLACTERVASPNNTQQNALNVTDGATPTSSMQIRITHAASSGGTVGSAIKSGSTITAGNNITINGQGGYTSPAYASTYTPDPYVATTHKMTLTGALTVNAPSQGHIGTRLSFVFVQDGTGGRVVTWNAAYKVNWTPTTTAGKINTIDFVYDGTNWIQAGSGVNL